MDTARQAILEHIHNAHALRRATATSDGSASCNAVSRTYRRAGSLDLYDRIALLRSRLEECDAKVHYASSTNIAHAIAEIIAGHNKWNIVVPIGIPAEWLPEEISFTIGDRLTAGDLDRFDGVLTGCAVAIAMTGSIVLQNFARQGSRKLSLIPDYHLCVVFSEQIVETVPEAWDRIAPTATLPTTLTSGPSATADIEMTRIKGVHGPRLLDVLIVE